MTADNQRFNSYVNVTSTCHLWTGKLDRDGYGLFWYQGKWMPAHAYAFGDVPPGHEIDHLCHRRNCVNRQHLEAVTHAENLARRSDRLDTYQPPAITGASDDRELVAVTTTAESTTGKARRPGTFAPGHDPRRNVNGRPPKGETFAEKYIAATERDADALIEAHLRRAKGSNAVAARDFETVAAYNMGRPVQPFVGVTGTAPADELFAEIAGLMSPAAPSGVET